MTWCSQAVSGIRQTEVRCSDRTKKVLEKPRCWIKERANDRAVNPGSDTHITGDINSSVFGADVQALREAREISLVVKTNLDAAVELLRRTKG